MRFIKSKRLIVVCATLIIFLMMFVAINGCAPKNREVVDDDEPGDSSGLYADNFSWTPDVSCVVCHAVQSNLTNGTEAAFHMSDQGNKCIDCHSNTSILTQVHQGKNSSSKPPTRITKAFITEDVCLSCHDSKEDLAKKTANSTKLKDDYYTVVNPHDLPVNDDHKIIVCVSCHVMHETKPIETSSRTYCFGCHHEKVFACYTCHEKME